MFVVIGLAMVPIYATADSIINLVQELYGLLSMPILSAFIVGLLFRDVAAGAAIIAVVLGVILYGFFSFVWAPLHYIHMMFSTVIFCVLSALTVIDSFSEPGPHSTRSFALTSRDYSRL